MALESDPQGGTWELPQFRSLLDLHLDKAQVDRVSLSCVGAVAPDQPWGESNYKHYSGPAFFMAQETLKTARDKPRSVKYQLGQGLAAWVVALRTPSSLHSLAEWAENRAWDPIQGVAGLERDLHAVPQVPRDSRGPEGKEQDPETRMGTWQGELA